MATREVVRHLVDGVRLLIGPDASSPKPRLAPLARIGEAGHPAEAGDPALFGRAAALAGIGAFQCELASERLEWTDGVFDLFGLDLDHPLDRREALTLYAEESRALLERLRTEAIAERGAFSMEAEIVRPGGERRWMRLTARVMSREGRPAWLYGIKQDITEERARWEALRRMAECDALTGLANRALFQLRFLDCPRIAPALAPLAALVLFDVDGFKQVNDRHGHAAGDACLGEIGRRLTAAFPDAAMVARIGGDEFALLVRGGRLGTGLHGQVEQALAMIAQPVIWRDLYLRVGTSAGVAVAAKPLLFDAEQLFLAADRALYTAKRVGRGTLRFGRPGLNRASLAARLAHA